MNTLFFGTGYWGKGAGNGPWSGRLRGGCLGLWLGASAATCPDTPSMAIAFPFGSLKTTSGKYAIRSANWQSGYSDNRL